MKGLVLVALALALVGCAGNPPRPEGQRPNVVVLPFENIGGTAESARIITRICQSELANNTQITLLESGDVEEALLRLRIRTAVLMSDTQRDSLQAALDCDYAVTGSVLGFGDVTHPYAGRVGVVSLAMQLLDMRGGRVVWSKTRSRQGSDGQWLFGLGVQRDPAVIADNMCRELLGQIRWNSLGR